MTLLLHAFLITVGIGLGWCLVLTVAIAAMCAAARERKSAIDRAFEREADELLAESRGWEK